MTPQERQLVSQLFDRLEKLEGSHRDPDAERAVADGFDRAPNAAYALVQTVLVQDEALKRANAHIEDLEAQLSGGAVQEQGGGGFLDNMRGMMSGREGGRGSVPSVRSAHGPGEGSSGLWNTAGRSDYGGGRGSYEPQQAAPPWGGQPASGGGSFLGTAAATAAGVVGGALLMNSIRGMFGPSHGGQSSSAFDPGLSGGGRTPGSGEAANSDLARDAGLGDIAGGGRSASYDGDRRAGLFGGDDQADDNDEGDDGDDFADDFDGGDTDTV
jgi:hypothetical protein